MMRRPIGGSAWGLVRWLPGAVVAVFLAALLIATACSVDCLGLSCAPVAEVAAEKPMHEHHGDPHSQEMPAPASHDDAPVSGDCATHGHSTVFRAQAATSFSKPQIADAGWSSAGLPLPIVGTTTLVIARDTLIDPRRFHSPPSLNHAALPLRI